MRLMVACVLASSCSGMALAADKPVFAPAPAWVKPIEAPAPPAKSDGGAVRVLLQDQQVELEPGRQTTYLRSVVAIQTPQGLAAGNLSVSWRPETDTFTVHKLQIRRGDKVIDVLASGQTFTVARRETNLDSAMLDGVLTGNIQPEGLQVGDVIDFAASVSSTDPTMRGHVEQTAGAWNVLPVARAHLRMEWPSTLSVRLRQTAALPALKPVKQGKTTSVELSLDTIEPLVLPKGAPPRYQIGRLVEATDFASWGDLARLMAPLYVKVATLPPGSPLQTEIDRLRGSSTDPVARAQGALALVQDRIRYVALSMGDGGIVPADAGTTWSRRFGDCKGKTVLLLTLLHALGIEAEPVAVSTAFGDGLDQRLPMVGLFNHVIVRARIGGRDYWLDGTRTGDRRLDRLAVPAFGWGLPLTQGSTALVRMVPAPLDTPTNEVNIRIDASAGLAVPAPTRVETVLRGDEALAANLGLANLSPEARDRALRDYWKGQYDFIDVRTATAAFDPDKGEERLAMEGTARMDWSSGWYETDGTAVGYKASFERQPGPDRDAPYAVPFPYYTRVTETIALPPGFRDTPAVAAAVDETAGGIRYKRQASIVKSVFIVEKSERGVQPEFAAKDAPAAQAALRALANKTLYLRKPDGYKETAKEVEAALAVTPTTADGFIERGFRLANQQRYAEAIAALDRAVALDPKSALALANRGINRVWTGDLTGGSKDLDAAAAIDPRNAIVYRARGLMAQRQDKPAEAIAAYTTSLEIEPRHAFTLGHRAEARHAAGDDDGALRDAEEATALEPSWLDLNMMRANIYRSRGDKVAVAREAARMTAANPNEAPAHIIAARLYQSIGRPADAVKAYDRAIAIKPAAYVYLSRASDRDKADRAGRRADIDAALKLEPASPDALAARARLQDDEGDHQGAVATWSKALVGTPGDPFLLTGRGLSQIRAGRAALADRDFAAARVKATNPGALNNICWTKATAGLALEAALADCDAALKKAPDAPAFLDSRAFTLLRMARLDEALADYDRALTKVPTQAGSLYGRGVVRTRKGDKEKAAADLAAATRIDPDVAKQFAGYGVAP